MMRRKKTNKNLVIIILLVLLLALAVGYAIFSDTLTISGTANANGSFDLQFQNVEVVNFAGILEENIITQVSEDANNLRIQVKDLQYPGAGVEFSVDIVNVGTIPAKVEEVGIMNWGSNYYKPLVVLKGLDVITTEHPIVNPNEKCNIHFTVEWPKEYTEPIDAKKYNDGIEFGLEIYYTQAVKEMFSGKIAHTHEDGSAQTPIYTIPDNLTAQAGQTLGDIVLPTGFSFQDDLTTSVGEVDGKVTFKATYTPEDIANYNIVTDIDIPINVVKTGKLTEIIDWEDYGKNIDYSVTVNEVKLDSWKIYSNNGTNVKIILDKYLPHDAIPQKVLDLGLEKVDDSNSYSYNNQYCVATRFTPTRKIDTLITALTTTEAWAELSASVPGAIAQGSPTLEDFLESMNALPDERPSNEKMETILKAHLPYKTELQNNYNLLGYWLATPASGDAAEYAAYAILYNSTGYYCYWNSGACGIRPVITLPSDLVGTLGDTVTIQK